MRQAAILIAYLIGQAGFVAGGFWLSVGVWAISPVAAFGILLFAAFEAIMVFVYVVTPLMIWAGRVDAESSLRRHR